MKTPIKTHTQNIILALVFLMANISSVVAQERITTNPLISKTSVSQIKYEKDAPSILIE